MNLIFPSYFATHLRHQDGIIIFRRNLVPKGRMQLFEIIPVDEIHDLSAGIPDIFVILQIILIIFQGAESAFDHNIVNPMGRRCFLSCLDCCQNPHAGLSVCSRSIRFFCCQFLLRRVRRSVICALGWFTSSRSTAVESDSSLLHV